MEKCIVKKYWFVAASISMGSGIWAMHFIGILALELKMVVNYNPFLVLVSMILPVITSSLAFFMLSREVNKKLLVLGGTVLGIGILLMHYIGMEAMIMNADIRYDPFWLSLSILIAILATNLAVQILMAFKDKRKKIWLRFLAAYILGITISSVHYAGMKATIFLTEFDLHQKNPQDSENIALAISIGITIFFIQLFIYISLYMDQQTSMKIKESEERYRQLVELSPIAIGIHKYGEVTYINPAGMKLLGANAAEDVIGKNILTFILPDYHDTIKKRWKIMNQNNKHVAFLEEKMLRLDNQIVDIEILALPTMINGKEYVQILFQDITERKKMEEMIHRLAYHDTLTGLPNRRLFEERLHKSLLVEPSDFKVTAVMFIDLDGFKQVNDIYGHDTGDILLINVSKRLKNCVRENDTVARLSGDEFTILLTDITESDVVHIAKKIIKALGTNFKINDDNIYVTPSIGISLCSDHEKHGKSLIKKADIAMYQAKQLGKNNYQFYR
ncbi:diguanylate cyclase domain-containing protein [Domibacillus epiphyticus]|uniref:diguanylate cyclase domain-containing protein n=1 Tax=Domibacillus epiphyticus TaxID=1714355 RepID=UPI001301313A|nr:diguanylate cyclase [Domibacillus epiphyticus]